MVQRGRCFLDQSPRSPVLNDKINHISELFKPRVVWWWPVSRPGIEERNKYFNYYLHIDRKTKNIFNLKLLIQSLTNLFDSWYFCYVCKHFFYLCLLNVLSVSNEFNANKHFIHFNKSINSFSNNTWLNFVE